MKTILVVLNSRKQTYLLYNLLLSFQETTKYPERLKICINIDDCDQESQEFAKFAKNNINLNLIFNSDERNYRLNDRLNISFRNYLSDFNWVLNTDTCIKTTHWDTIVDQYSGVKALYVEDDGEYGLGKQYCFFPILSKELLGPMKCFFPPSIYNLGADVALHDVLKDFPIIEHVPIKVWHYKYHGLIPRWITTDSSFVNNLSFDGQEKRMLQERIGQALANSSI